MKTYIRILGEKMYDTTSVFLNMFLIFLLVFIRMISIFVISPIFSRRNIPSYLKVGLALFCTFTIAPLLGSIQIDYNLMSYTILVIKEFVVGITLGFVSYLVFASLLIAGQIMDVQIGFGMVNVIDPINNIQVPLIGNFIYLLATNIFLITNGHHIMLAAIVKSYAMVPINGFFLTDKLVNNILRIFIESFVIGFKISIPIIAAALLSEVALGILSRTVPQMNVFIVGLPMKITIGLLSLIFIMPTFANALDYIFDKLYAYISIILQSMTKG